MKKKTVLLFTDSYPYGNSEAFLESEILEWGKLKNINIILFPLLSTSEKIRNIPQNCTCDTHLQKKLNFYQKGAILLFPLVFTNPFFWKEIKSTGRELLCLKKIRKLIATSMFSIIISRYLRNNYSSLLKPGTLFYSYWFYYAAYAGALLKHKHYDFELITRAHGMDIFQNRKDTGCYLPFRTFEISSYFSKIFTVSQVGMDYLHSNQKIPLSKLNVSYLGVYPPKSITPFPNKNKLVIVSCSNIIPVKRIELIIEGLAHYKQKKPKTDIHWHHIGSGAKSSSIQKLAKSKLANINYKFHGQLRNKEVFSFYQNTKIDGFVSTSSSEGLPVSIMEALYFGIPVLATAVGGVPEAVNKEVGYLLNQNFTLDEFILGIQHILKFKSLEQRKTISQWAHKNFNATTNYNNFIRTIISK